MGRFPRLTPVRLGHQVPDLTTVSERLSEFLFKVDPKTFVGLVDGWYSYGCLVDQLV